MGCKIKRNKWRSTLLPHENEIGRRKPPNSAGNRKVKTNLGFKNEVSNSQVAAQNEWERQVEKWNFYKKRQNKLGDDHPIKNRFREVEVKKSRVGETGRSVIERKIRIKKVITREIRIK